MKELELYKLLVTDDNKHGVALAQEIRWITGHRSNELLVWVSYLWVKEFVESIKDIFGDCIFDECGFKGMFQRDGFCIDLEELLEGYGICLDELFPYDKYSD